MANVNLARAFSCQGYLITQGNDKMCVFSLADARRSRNKQISKSHQKMTFHY